MATMLTPQTFDQAADTPPGALIRLEAMINAEVALQLADMASLRQFITYVGSINGTGSDTIRYRTTNLGAKSPMAAAADGAAVAGSNMDGTVADVTVSRSALVYSLSDLFSLTSFGNDIDPFFVANAMSKSAEARMNQVICATFDSATTSKGTAGLALDVDAWTEALYALEEANNGSKLTCVLKNKAFTDLQKSLRTENNNFLSYDPGTAAMSAAKPQGYCGELLGVSIFRSDYVQDNGPATDWVSAMFSQDAIGFGTGSPELVGASAEFRPAGSPLVVEFARESSKGSSQIIGHMYFGANILEDARIVKLISVK